MKTLITLLCFGAMLLLTSCGDSCETCTVTTQITQNGSAAGGETLHDGVEFCDEELDAIKESAGNATLEIQGIMQVTSTIVDCK